MIRPSRATKTSSAPPRPRRRPRVTRVAAAHPKALPIAAEEPEADRLPDQPFAEGAQDAMDPDLRHRLISEAAYRRYTDRGYAEGYDLDDWLAAEAEIDHLLVDRAVPGADGRG